MLSVRLESAHQKKQRKDNDAKRLPGDPPTFFFFSPRPFPPFHPPRPPFISGKLGHAFTMILLSSHALPNQLRANLIPYFAFPLPFFFFFCLLCGILPNLLDPPRSPLSLLALELWRLPNLPPTSATSIF